MAVSRLAAARSPLSWFGPIRQVVHYEVAQVVIRPPLLNVEFVLIFLVDVTFLPAFFVIFYEVIAAEFTRVPPFVGGTENWCFL